VRVKRIVADFAAESPSDASRFYRDVFGAPVQVSFMSQGGSGALVPDLSIEVDDLDEALARVHARGIAIESGRSTSPGACAGSSCAIPSAT
jgi:hypothetical protein